ncbi:MAG: aldehyde dehydrogenase family protein [Rhizobiales bacterium TMED94]|nr:aldehyde dehydrogenase family protein [Rhodobiaceae bacterium]RPF87077.1 MAG: aldehyde dehydrogenase family protein [Rhizobiales bacterium TMED94]|tara:strand:- start:1790 stop:3220 length:1431 start_codon:yes stop_codon:yes gene_type:complete
MKECMQFYINGEWVDPVDPKHLDVINPATEETIGKIAMGNSKDVDKAVAAAKEAFESFSQTSKEERLALMGKILEVYQSRYDEIAEIISSEMGAPLWLSKAAQAATGAGHFGTFMEVLKNYNFDEDKGTTRLRKEPVGVCGLITPWNWPINQIACKVAPALAAGCTMVLKPSEVSPLNAVIFAEVLHEAGVPAGVFNLVNGDGLSVGEAMSSHSDIDMMSFTGSTRAGVAVAKASADTVKRVSQELGGKSANIILDDADFNQSVAGGVTGCFMNSGQSCNAPTRMLVPADRQDEAVAIAKATAEATIVGDPKEVAAGGIGPVVSEVQFNKIQGLIEKGIEEGATLVAGGPGKPEGFNAGYYVKPTIFSDVSNDMTIAREEIFGPVLSILPYKNEDDAISIANDTEYGLSGYVSGSQEKAQKFAEKFRSGNVHVNGAGPDFNAPFGGYKKSGNGREWGDLGFEEFLEIKAILGYNAA